MCGISGIITVKSTKVSTSKLKEINDKILHRGPDAEGYYFYNTVGLGHRRLSILDLSPSGNQPMIYGSDLVITYNGEVYNYLELKYELQELGYIFNNGTDTEVILASYNAWGVDCLNKFNGMWSFAIIDKRKNIVFMSRDRFGVKPLYYSQNSGDFIFGSEIKQLLNDDSNDVELSVLTEYMLTYIDNHTEKTYFKGVYSLLPGNYLIYNLSDNCYETKSFYNLEEKKDIKKLTEMSAINHLKDLLKSSVELRLRSDVKVGTCLSGGLDSSAISAIAKKLYLETTQNELTAIHARSIDAATDESGFAKKVASYVNLDLHIVTPSTEDFKSLVDEVIYTQEEPFGSPSMFMGYLVFKRAKELNCKVMLNGQGGDEVLLGYERYFSSYLFGMNLSSFIKQLWLQRKNSGLKLHEPVLYFLYFTSFKLRKKMLQKRSYLTKEIKRSFSFDTLKENVESFKNIQSLQKHEISVAQLPHLLRYEDRNSMRHSIETRLPFLDYRIVEAGISFVPSLKIRDGWTKYILRKALYGFLPNSVIWRKNKLGFNAPERIWLKEHENEMLYEIEQSKILQNITNYSRLLNDFRSMPLKDKWLYYNVAVWERIYKVKY